MATPIKRRKKRKPMTPEQKAAAVERLAKARAARAAANPPEYKNIAPEVLALPDDHNLSLKNVRKWIKTQTDLRAEYNKQVRTLNKRGNAPKTKELAAAISAAARADGYIKNLQRYIRDGVYMDMFYGEYGTNRIRLRCTHPSYDKEGNMKFSHGVFYPQLGYVYGEEPTDD